MSAHPLALAQPHEGPIAVEAPMVCTHGPRSRFHSMVTMAQAAPAGSTITVRIDSQPSGRISALGLFSIFAMTTDFAVAPGAQIVEGSVHLVPDSGTPNVLAGARAWQDDAGVHLSLPAHVQNGGSYTPPSLELCLLLDGAPGTDVSLRFERYAVKASVFLVGTIETSCEPSSKPCTLSTLRVEAAADAGGRAP